MEENQDDRRDPHKNALPDGNSQCLTDVPGVNRENSPESVEEKSAHGTERQKQADEKCGEGVRRCRERTHAEDHDEKRRRREKGGNGDSEEKCRHGNEVYGSLSY